MDGRRAGTRWSRRGLLALSGLLALVFGALPARGQAPFATDDAGVTEAGRWHFELFAQQSDLRRIDRPATGQTTVVASAATGLFGWLEIGVDAPWISIALSDQADVDGIGDLNLSFKARLREAEGRLLPAVAVTAAVEFPTGDKGKSLGSGVYDYSLNLVGDWQLAASSALRLNLGVLFSGNDLTGAVGLRSDKQIFSSGISITQTLSPRWDVGLELHGAEAYVENGGRHELSAQVGARYALHENVQLGMGVARGWEIAPEWQFQFGLIADF